MQSMTGYGKAEYNDGGITLVCEIRTVNNRFLDMVPKYPRAFTRYDDLIRKVVASKITRGRVELFITLKDLTFSEKNYTADLSLARGYYAAYVALKKEFPDLTDDFGITSLLRLPDVVVQDVPSDDDRYKGILCDVLDKALDNLISMRRTEGDKLMADLSSRIDTVSGYVTDIELYAPLVKDFYRTRIEEVVKTALSGKAFDEARVLEEVAVFADKSNIDEEITRLKSHILQFREIIKTDGSGRKLDFLIQEFNREANTICSKANDLQITNTALKLKCEIEKIREQVQNIE